MGRKVGGSFERQGTYVYLWLIHVDTWQKLTQYCKVIIFQLKIFLKNLRRKTVISCCVLLSAKNTPDAGRYFPLDVHKRSVRSTGLR